MSNGSESKPRQPWSRRPWLPDAGYLLLTLILFAEVWLGSARLINRDLLQYFLPIGETLTRAWHGGGSFLWDSGMNLGTPLLARWTPALFYPAHALFAVLPTDLALSLAVILHFPLAAAATRRLALRYTHSHEAAFVAGLGYGLGGYLLSMAGGGTYLYGAALLPLDLLALHRLLERISAGRIVQLAIVVALQVFCADPQTLYFNVLIIWPLVLVVRSRAGERWRAWLSAAGAGALAVGMAFCQIWPSLEFAALSVRSKGFGYDEIALWSLHPLRLLEMVVPLIFGGTTPASTYWASAILHNPHTDVPWAFGIHVGLLLLVAWLWLSWREQRRSLALWGALTLFFFLLASGAFTPIHRLVIAVLPGGDRFRYPEKFMVFVSLGLVLLGAMGLGRLLGEDGQRLPTRRGWLTLLLLGALLVVLRLLCNPASPASLEGFSRLVAWLGGNVVVPISMRDTAEALARGAGVALALALLLMCWPRLRSTLRTALLLLLAMTEVILAGLPLRHLGGASWLRERPLLCQHLPAPEHGLPPLVWRFGLERVPNSRLTAGLSSHIEKRQCWEWHSLLANLGIPSCVRHLQGYEAAIVQAHPLLLERLAARRPQDVAPVFGLQLAITAPDLLDSRLYPVRARLPELGLVVHQMPGLPYAYSVAAAELASGVEVAVERVTDPAFDYRRIVILEGQGAPPQQSSPAARRVVRLLAHRPGRIQLEAEFDSAGFLVVLETYYPGWRATVDGRPGDLRRANGLFMGLPLSAGRHQVTLAFTPSRQRSGNVVSLASVSIAGLALVVSGWWRRRRLRLRSVREGGTGGLVSGERGE